MRPIEIDDKGGFIVPPEYTAQLVAIFKRKKRWHYKLRYRFWKWLGGVLHI